MKITSPSASQSVTNAAKDLLRRVLGGNPDHDPAAALKHLQAANVIGVLGPQRAVVIPVVLDGDFEFFPSHVEVRDRLAEIVVKIPSLAERPGDAALLAKAFMARFAKEMNPAVKGFAPDALAAIDAWPWPGNVRELENRVKRAVIMSDSKLIGAADLDLAAPSEEGAQLLNLKCARELADRKVIRHALARSEGNISNTAKLLGISRPTLYDLLKQYDLHA